LSISDAVWGKRKNPFGLFFLLFFGFCSRHQDRLLLDVDALAVLVGLVCKHAAVVHTALATAIVAAACVVLVEELPVHADGLLLGVSAIAARSLLFKLATRPVGAHALLGVRRRRDDWTSRRNGELVSDHLRERRARSRGRRKRLDRDGERLDALPVDRLADDSENHVLVVDVVHLEALFENHNVSAREGAGLRRALRRFNHRNHRLGLLHLEALNVAPQGRRIVHLLIDRENVRHLVNRL
jgi:hypothetical protein